MCARQMFSISTDQTDQYNTFAFVTITVDHNYRRQRQKLQQEAGAAAAGGGGGRRVGGVKTGVRRFYLALTALEDDDKVR